MKICVIGCGTAGLAALRVLSEEIESYPFCCKLYGLEKTNCIGGVWNYDENITKEFVSPMYRELRTNLPKEVMPYPDWPFPDDLERSFIHHSDVLKYIKSYAKKYDLERYIEFNSNIKNVEPITTNGITQWQITITNTISSLTDTRIFDVVIVSNGHFEQCLIPEVKGIEHFKGEVMHSKYYRVPEIFKNKTVFIVGAKNSGTDIALQLAKCAHKIYISHNNARLKCRKFTELVQETYGIMEVDDDGLICTTDGNKYKVDVIIFCTGYKMSLDFLSDSCKIRFDNCYVRPLYKHMISPYYPTSLFFIGLGYEITPFTFFYMQSKVIRAILQNCSKEIILTTDNLLAKISSDEKQLDNLNVSLRHRHFFNRKLWPYFEWCELVAENIINFKVPRHLKYMFDIVKKWRFENTDLYREIDMELCNDNDLGFIIKRGPDYDFYSDDFDKCFENF